MAPLYCGTGSTTRCSSKVLNLSYKPATGEKDLFEAKQYMYAVLDQQRESPGEVL